jgi:hypothetical protein
VFADVGRFDFMIWSDGHPDRGRFAMRYGGMYRSFFGSLCEMMPMCSRTFALVIRYP